MDKNEKLPPAFEIFKQHKVTPFVSGIFGTTVGHLIDRGLTDLELLTVMEEFAKMIRSAAQDPSVLRTIEKQVTDLRRHAENPNEQDPPR